MNSELGLRVVDLVLLESEVNPVLSKLQDNGIEISAVHNHVLNEQPRVMYMHYMGQITALHSHMLDENPRLFFMHFWANDDAVKVARGLRAALEKTNSAM